jgi:hypothetical protein
MFAGRGETTFSWRPRPISTFLKKRLMSTVFDEVEVRFFSQVGIAP